MNWREEYAKSLMTLGDLALLGLAFKGGEMDNYTLTMLGLTVFIVLFGLAVDRLTREDPQHKGQSK
jgi:hypothetical protein